MKQVAGSMKLELAQFRELEAFSQFASDLDDKTKAQLERGVRVNDILKQGWDVPLSVAEQVVIIFAAVNGFLDNIKIEDIGKWEEKYLEYINDQHEAILESIDKEGKLLDETKADLENAVKDFNSSSNLVKDNN